MLKDYSISPQELQKLKNKSETALVFSEVNILNKAINLAFFEVIGNADLINEEAERYQRVTTDDIQRVAMDIFTHENCSKLVYKAKK